MSQVKNCKKIKRRLTEIISNPFTPNFGQVPKILAGRELLIRHCVDALKSNGNHVFRNTLLTEAKGCGKSALLSYLDNKAEELAWVVVHITIVDKVLRRIVTILDREFSSKVQNFNDMKLKSSNLANIATFEFVDPQKPVLTDELEQIKYYVIALNLAGYGVLFELDEIDPLNSELSDFIKIYSNSLLNG